MSTERAHCQLSAQLTRLFCELKPPGPLGPIDTQLSASKGNSGVGVNVEVGTGVTVGVAVNVAHCPLPRQTADSTGKQSPTHCPPAGGPHEGRLH